MKFYRLDKQEVINTVTDIPSEQWERKQVLPYTLNIIKVEKDTATDVIEGIVVLEDEVIETKIELFTVPTLQEYKENKYSEVKSIGSMFILETYSQLQQLSAYAGFYSDEENEAIRSFCKTNFDKIRLLGISIRESTTKEEVDTFNWVD